MLKLCIYVYLCFCSKLVKYNVVVGELLMNSIMIVVMRYCCWWLKPWVILTIEIEVNLCCSWSFSWKMGQMVIFVEMMFWFKFYMDLSVFSCLETFRKNFGIKFGHWQVKIEILEWKMGFSQELPVIAHHGE